MFPLSPTAYKYIAIAVFVGLAALGWKMYWSEHTALITFKAQVEQAGRDQKAASDKQDQLNKENANVAEQNTISAVKGIHDYYVNHPVRVFVGSSCGPMPQASGDSKGTRQAGGSEVPPAYISQYTPEETELLASQLNRLLILLHDDGAKFE